EVLVKPDISFSSLLVVAQDPNVDAVLYPIPMEYSDTTLAACTNMVRAQAQVDKLIIPVWMSDKTGTGYDKLVQEGMIPIRSLSRAIQALARWNQYGRWLTTFDPHWRPAIATRTNRRQSADTQHTYSEREAKALLAAAGIRV